MSDENDIEKNEDEDKKGKQSSWMQFKSLHVFMRKRSEKYKSIGWGK